MKSKIFLLIFLAVLFGCSDNETTLDTNDGVSYEDLEAAPKHIVSRDNLPTWMISQIDEVERFPIMWVKIYQGDWNKKKVFLIFNFLQSCLAGEPYYEDGKNILNSSEYSALYENFYTKSENWKLIYENARGSGYSKTH